MSKRAFGTVPNYQFSDSFNTPAIIRVGRGRGFVVAGKHSRFVITATHCLGDARIPIQDYETENNTYTGLLGPLGSPTTLAAKCVFADSIHDLAIVALPEPPVYKEERSRFIGLTERVFPFAIGPPPAKCFECFVLSGEQQWFDARAEVEFRSDGPTLWFFRPTAAIVPEMIGSPILTATGTVIGVLGSNVLLNFDLECEGAPLPVLFPRLPSWFLSQVLGQGAGSTSCH